MSLDKQLGDTLALVNVARQAFGQTILTDLPDSRPGDSSDCLFYRALAPLGCLSVGGEGQMEFDDERKANYIGSVWGVEVTGRTVRAPKQFHSVIKGFDTHQTPQYETQEKPHF